MSKDRGFTLIEIIVILAVLSILVAMAIPAALRIFERTAEDTTREEMANLKKAMIGDPQKLQSSFRSDFGFIGDIGCLPTVLDRLLTVGTLPTPYSFDSAKQAGAGWNGPYITGAAQADALSEYTKDQWGNDYTYSASGGCPLTATLTSNGPGTSTTADDITISIAATETTATTVRGTVKDRAGVGIESVPVELYSAVGGTLTTTSTTTDASGNYTFGSVPFGPRAVRALPRLIFSPGSVTTGGGGTDITFRVVNYSQSSILVTHMMAEYTVAGTYNQIQINGTAVDPAGSFANLTVVNITDTSIAAGPTGQPSLRIFVDNPDSQLPDITVIGLGTTATIEINNFTNDMRGNSIKVTFNPPPSIQPMSVVLVPIP